MFQRLETKRTLCGVAVDVYRAGRTLLYIPLVPSWRSPTARRMQWRAYFG